MIKLPPPADAVKQRNSSIELYRIIATFCVLIVHFNGWFVGGMPEKFDLGNPTLFRTGQMIIEAATCICVNMFLLISGYFGIRLKLSSVLRIFLLLLFIKVPFSLWALTYDESNGIRSLFGSLLVFSNAGYFIQCYLMLMFLSPMLNAFIDKYGKKILPWVVIFILIEFYFDIIRPTECLGFVKGYSVMHFVLMYLLARCIKLFKHDLLRLKVYYWICSYFLSTLMICFLYIIGIKWIFWYSNPLVVISSVCSFIPFIYYNYYSKIINWVASSTFAVYIIQVTRPAYDILVNVDNEMLNSYSYGLYLVFAVVVILLFFFFCILYDKLCGMLITPIINKVKEKLDGWFKFV